MWGGPLREAIWATRGIQEEPRNRKDKTNNIAERPQSDDDLRENGQQKRQNGIAKAMKRPQSDDRFVKKMKKHKKKEAARPAGARNPFWLHFGGRQMLHILQYKPAPLKRKKLQMWGGPLREVIWATRGSQEETRTEKTIQRMPQNGRRVTTI